MGKYNNKEIDNMIQFSIANEKSYDEANKLEHGTSDYFYFHGKSEAYHDMAHYLVELKKNR